MDADEFIERNRKDLEDSHGWELKFTQEVLRQVPDLDFAAVSTQTPLTDRGGRSRRIDFTISEPGGVRVALEVDGYDKTGSNTGMTADQFVEWSRREQDIVSQGWRLLRFANRLVRDDPAFCVRSIEETLRLERALRSASSQSRKELEDLRLRIRRADERAAASEGRLAKLLAAGGPGRSNGRTLADLVSAKAEAEADRRASEAVLSQAAAKLLPSQTVDQAGATLHARAAAASGQQELIGEALSRARAAEGENKKMKVLAISMAVVAVAVAVVVALLASTGVLGGDDAPAQVPRATANPQASGACAGATDWKQAKSLVGESATVTGPVLSGTYRSGSRGKPTFLNVGAPFGDDAGFTVVVFGESRSKFPKAPEAAYDDKTIAVTGRVTEFDGRAQMIINSPSAIERC